MKNYPWKEKLAGPLKDTHEVIRILVDPIAMGFPTSRLRSFTLLINKATLTWMGPSQDHIQAAFDEMMCRELKLDGRAFMNGTFAEVNEMLHQRAHKQKHRWPAEFDAVSALQGDNGSEVLQEVLPSGLFNRFRDWEAARLRRAVDGQASVPEAFFSDCDHNVGHGPHAGAILPTGLTHGTLMSHVPSRPLTIWELLSSYGWHLHEQAIGDWAVSQRKEILQQASQRGLGVLAGNGMHLPSLVAVLMFALIHLAWRPPLRKPIREVPLGRKGGTQFWDDFDADESPMKKQCLPEQLD